MGRSVKGELSVWGMGRQEVDQMGWGGVDQVNQVDQVDQVDQVVQVV